MIKRKIKKLNLKHLKMAEKKLNLIFDENYFILCIFI